MDFKYDEHEEKQKLLREVALRDQEGYLFYDKLHFKFVQMPLFSKQAHELETHFDKWLYFLKNRRHKFLNSSGCQNKREAHRQAL